MAIAGRSYTNTPVISRGSLEDASDFDSPTKQVVVSSSSNQYFNPGARHLKRSSRADVPVGRQPIVVSASSTLYFNPTKHQSKRSSKADVVPPSAAPASPIVASTSSLSFFAPVPHHVKRSSKADVIPQAAPSPIVVTRPFATGYFDTPKHQTKRSSKADVVVTPTSGTLPVVISSTGAAYFLTRKPHVSKGHLGSTGPQPDTRTALQLGGTVGIPNLLGGAVSVVRVKAGSLTVLSPIAGTLTLKSVNGTAVVSPVLAGTAVVISPYSSSLVEWTMQEVDIVLAEFNDETVNLAITSSGSALNITGYTLEMYLKPVRGSSDTASGVVKLSTATGEITVTNAAGGLATVAIPASDFTSVNDVYTFYRVDTIDTNSKRNTAIFGLVTITQL